MRCHRVTLTVLVVGSAVAGCSAASPPAGSGTPAPSAGSATSAAAGSAPQQRSVRLGCVESGSGTLSDETGPPLTVGPVSFEGFRAQVREVPRAADVGLRTPAGQDSWRFRKVPVYLPAGSAVVTLSMSPGAAVAFAWVPAQAWTSGAPDLSRYAATSVSFASCPDRTATYFGGFLAASPDTCVRFRLGDGRTTTPVSRRLDGAACSA